MDMPRLKIGLTEEYLPVYIKGKDRCTALAVIGKSGTGKTNFLSNICANDSYYPISQIIIGPSEDLPTDCYSILKGRTEYVSIDHPYSFNPMTQNFHPNQIVDTVTESINQFVTYSTPNERLSVKMLDIVKNGIFWCLERNRKSLLHVRDYIQNLKGDAETRDGIVRRLNYILADDRLIPIICGNNSIDWEQFISQGKRIVVNGFGIGTGRLVFFGSLVVQGLRNYFRFTRPKEYKPVSLIIDEAQLFITRTFMSDILREGRKYKIAVTLATQSFAGIDPDLTRLMLNVGNIISFRIGNREAQSLGKELLCEVEKLQLMDKYYAAYLTGNETGIVKAPRPPLFQKLELKKEAPPKKQDGWFELKPLSA